jgi:RNA polymerase sigma-70 factor (ECF subfamily)
MDEAELREQLACAHIAAYGWALACCGGDQVAAEEALHDVYVSILEHRARYEGKSAFRTWLFGVIRVTAAAQRRRSWLRSLLLARNETRVRPAAPLAPDAAASERSRNDKLRDALALLSSRQREVLHLVFYQDFTIEGAAGVMHVSLGSARTHYARGKARLAQLLGGPDL